MAGAMKDPRVEQVKRRTSDQYVVFQLGKTRFGVGIDQVLRVVRLTPVTRVPRSPHFLEGVINFHGRVVPVVDLKKRLALAGGETYGEAARILIVGLESPSRDVDEDGSGEARPVPRATRPATVQPIGMLVDNVVGISRLAEGAIEPPPEMVAQINGVYLTGVAHEGHDDGERLIVLLDLSQVLTVEEVAEVRTWQAEREV
jgi:purine-binding chemotaxis protein CheW